MPVAADGAQMVPLVRGGWVRGELIMRCVAAAVLSALLLLAPASAHAQVYEMIKGCKSSLTLVIACVVVERGAEKVFDVGLDGLIAYMRGERKDIGPVKPVSSPAEAEAVRASAIPWPEFKAFLASTFGREPTVDPAQQRKKIGEACAAKYSPVCAQFGFFDPNRFTGCGGLAQSACVSNLGCKWTGSVCTRGGGTKDLLRQ